MYTDDRISEPCCDLAAAAGVPCACRFHARYREWVAADPGLAPLVLEASLRLAGRVPPPRPPTPIPPPPLPSLVAQAIAFARAQVRHVADGRAKVTPEVAAARVAACEACDRFRPDDRRCSAAGCGCYIDRKAAYRSESCPLGRWPAPAPEPEEPA